MTTIGPADHLGPHPDISNPGPAGSPPIAHTSSEMSAQPELLNASDPYIDGYFRSSHAAYPSYSSNSPDSSKLGSISSEENVPLSMRFMHKPLRSNEQLKKASDPTRRNSLANAHIDDSPSSPVLDPAQLRRALVDGYRLVRKKLGEIVKSLLKDGPSRSKSLPSTPSFKLVHFGGDADVRYFSRKDRPTAILALNSPALLPDSEEDEESNAEMDYLGEEFNTLDDSPHSSAAITKYPTPHHGRLIDWAVSVLNFPSTLLHDRLASIRPPVFLERVFISIDKRFLLGHIAVSNITYEKNVTVRYTLDNWATIVEIPTIYVLDIPSALRKHNYDRFAFKIPLDSMFNSFHLQEDPSDLSTRQHQKTYHMCIRYTVPGHQFWDNNGGKDYLIKLNKTIRSSEQLAGPDFVADNKKLTPRLRGGGSKVPPKTARSKPEAHSQRPKYSSHYLRRFHSEPDLKEAKPSPKQPEKSDFEKNGFYLSSPLFSSIKNNRGDAFYDDRDNLKDVSGGRHLLKSHLSKDQKLSSTLAPSTDPNSRDSSVDDEPSPMEADPLLPSDETPPVSLSGGFLNLINLKSYKELLDSYCFFTTPSHQSNSDTSPDSFPPKDSGPERFLDREDAFTVSSYLRK